MIRVDRLRKEFKVSRKMRKELGAGAPLGKTLTAVDGVSFECKPGRVFGLLGPNGAGKTTVLRLIATMLKPTSGTITVAGADAEREPQRVRSAIGFMTGNTGLYDRLTVTEMVRYHADLHGMDPARFEQRRRDLFRALDMEGFADRRIARLVALGNLLSRVNSRRRDFCVNARAGRRPRTSGSRTATRRDRHMK